MISGALFAALVAAGVPTIVITAKGASPGFVFSAAGDFAAFTGFSETLDQLKATDSRFVLALGDLSYGGTPRNATSTEVGWCDKFHRSFADVEIVAGNHDVGQYPYGEGNIDNFTIQCPFTLPTSLTGRYGREYYFDWPQPGPLARFILISPDLIFDNTTYYDYHVNESHYNWTRDAIDDARVRNIPWVIVGMHKDCIGAGEHDCETGADIFNLLLEKKVDLIIQAHNHNYERSKQLAISAACPGIVEHLYNGKCEVNDGSSGQYEPRAGSVAVIAGTGGRSIDEFNSSSPYTPYFATWMGNDSQKPQPTGNPAFGNGVVTYTVDADHITGQTHLNASYADSFTISSPVAGSFPQLLYVFTIAGLGVAVAVGVLVWRWRKARARS